MAKALRRICFFMMLEIVAFRPVLASQIRRRRAHFRPPLYPDTLAELRSATGKGKHDQN
jgi:hypothetical protein